MREGFPYPEINEIESLRLAGPGGGGPERWRLAGWPGERPAAGLAKMLGILPGGGGGSRRAGVSPTGLTSSRERSGETPLGQPARRQRSGRKPLKFRPLSRDALV